MHQQEAEEEGVSDEVRDPMCKIHNLAVEFYCQKHNTPVCSTCKLMVHRNCQLQNLEHAAKDTTDRHIEVLQELRETESHMKKIEDVLGTVREGLNTDKDVVIEKITSVMKEFDALGKKKIAEVQTLFDQECATLGRESGDIAQANSLVKVSITELKKAANVGSKEEIFIATKKAEDDVSKYQDIINESSKATFRHIDFKVDSKVKDIASLGNVSLEKSTVSVDHTPSATDVLNSQQSVKIIFWLDILQNGKTILLSRDRARRTSELSLYSVNKKLMSQLEMSDAISADMLDDLQVIVPLANEGKLQIVNMDNSALKPDRVISTNGYPALVLKYTDSSVLVCARQQDDKRDLQILDLSGRVQRRIKPLVDIPAPMGMRASRDRQAIYILDRNIGCIGFNLKGEVTFHYNSTYDVNYGVLAKGQHDVLYLSASFKKENEGTSKVIKLSPTGQVLRQVDIAWKHPLQCIGNKLYLVRRNEQGEYVVCYILV